jgi:sulfur carrier protein
MRIEVNGRSREVDDGLRLGALVDGEVEARRGVAVAVDGEVVPRARWDDTVLAPDTRVEIVAAVQGG